MKQKTKTQIKAASLAVLALGAGMGVGSYAFPQTITEEVEVEKVVTETVTEEVEVEVPVEKEVIVEVDNENLALVLDTIYENDGDVEYLLDGLDEDEVDQIVDRILWGNEVVSLGEQEAKSELKQLVHNSGVSGETLDQREVSNVRVTNSEALYKDYEYQDADVSVELFFMHEGKRYEAEVTVSFFDDKVDEVVLNSVNLI